MSEILLESLKGGRVVRVVGGDLDGPKTQMIALRNVRTNRLSYIKLATLLSVYKITGKRPTAEESLAAVRRIVARSVHLYGPSHGRDLWNSLRDIAREIETADWVERLGDDPRKVCEEIGAIEE